MTTPPAILREKCGFFMHLPLELKNHIPQNSIEIINAYWKKHPFHLKMSNHRQTKSGDYRYIPENREHLISVNKSLNQYQFLFTLVHEIAHQWVRISYKRRQSPHGKAWKDMFKQLLEPFLLMNIFPDTIQKEVKRHMVNPKASSSADVKLYHALQYDKEGVFLKDVDEGMKFKIGKKWFVKGPKRRTRYLCYALPDNRKYTISSIATIELESSNPSGDI